MKANFFGLPSSLNLANGIVLNASRAMMTMLNWIILGNAAKPVIPANIDWFDKSNKVNRIVEINKESDAVL